MKKFYVCAIIALLSITAVAQETIGTFTLSLNPNQVFSVDATQPKDYAFEFWVQVPGEYRSDKVYFNFKSGKTGEMYDALSQCKTKFLEWKKTAEDHGVKDMYKDFGIKFPKVTLAWWGSEWRFCFGHNISCSFMATETGCVAIIAGEGTASDNRYITQKYYLMFKTAEDFDALLSFLDNGIVYEFFNNKQSVDDLFK